MSAEISSVTEVDSRFRIRVGSKEIALSDSFVRRGEQRIYDATTVSFVDGAKEELVSKANAGKFFILYATHKSHYDGRPLGKATRILRELVNPYLPENDQLKGFAMPIAASIASGHQGQEVKKAVGMFSRLSEEQDQFYLIDYVREKDKVEFKMKDNTREYLREMKNHLAANEGIALLPEATVEGGRNFESGELIGLRLPEPGSIYITAKWAEKQGKDPVLVPVVLTGTHKVFRPGRIPKDYKVPTETVIKATVPMVPHEIVTATIGRPVDLEQAVKESSHDGTLNMHNLDLYLARLWAEMTPEEELGGFGKHLLAIHR